MGLDRGDNKPSGMSLAEAYERVRQWYSQNFSLLHQKSGGREYAQKSEALINALPPASQVSELEIRAVFSEVISGYLEWAYHQTDGQYKMAAYAHGALEAAGLDWRLSEAEKQGLRGSPLWQHLRFNR